MSVEDLEARLKKLEDLLDQTAGVLGDRMLGERCTGCFNRGVILVRTPIANIQAAGMYGMLSNAVKIEVVACPYHCKHAPKELGVE